MPQDNDMLQTKLAIQRLDQNQQYTNKSLSQMSNSLNELVTLQKNHEVLSSEIKADKKYNNNRITKIENNHVWLVRLIVATVVLKAVSLLWPIV